jgi:hypothetical protein
MAAFPADWQIYDSDDFHTFGIPQEEANTDLGTMLCVQLRGDGRAADHYRIIIFGSGLIATTFSLATLFQLPNADSYQLLLECSAACLEPRLNMTTSAWTDVEEMLRSNTITLLDAAGAPVDNTELLAQLSSSCPKKQAVGASLRWAVAVADGGKLELQLQGLPLPAKFLTAEPILKSDNIPTIRIGAWPLHADLFDGTTHAGPVPTFFATDKAAALAAISANIAEAYEGDYDTLNHVSNTIVTPPRRQILSTVFTSRIGGG